MKGTTTMATLPEDFDGQMAYFEFEAGLKFHVEKLENGHYALFRIKKSGKEKYLADVKSIKMAIFAATMFVQGYETCQKQKSKKVQEQRIEELNKPTIDFNSEEFTVTLQSPPENTQTLSEEIQNDLAQSTTQTPVKLESVDPLTLVPYLTESYTEEFYLNPNTGSAFSIRYTNNHDYELYLDNQEDATIRLNRTFRDKEDALQALLDYE